jgi:hypothetical protein
MDGEASYQSPDGEDVEFDELPPHLREVIDRNAGEEGYGVAGETKFAKWQLPDGENYRELLLTLPTPPNRFQTKLKDREFRDRTQALVDEWNATKDEGRKLAINAELDRLNAEWARETAPRDFVDPHFADTPNILAHVRFNERTVFAPLSEAEQAVADERARLQDEVARLWLAMGEAVRQTRRELDPIKAKIDKEVLEDFKAGKIASMLDATWERMETLPKTPGQLRQKALNEAREALQKKIPPAPPRTTKRVMGIEEFQSGWGQLGREEGFAPTASQRAEIDKIAAEVDAAGGFDKASPELQARARKAGEALTKGAIPSAPFVTKTEAWVRLALSRMIRYAAENGFDAIAFTTGEQQAKRYDLSQHVDHIDYWHNKDGTFNVSAEKGDEQVWHDDRATEKIVAEALGKEIAEKIVNKAGVSIMKLKDHPGAMRLADLDLKVGGEGMLAFYDKIVPNVANDLLKKLGGGRVGSLTIETGPDPSDDPDTTPISDDGTVQRTLHAFDITPELRARAMQGMPMFSKPFNKPPASDAPMASVQLNLPEALQSAPVRQSIRDRVADIFATQKNFNWWHKSIGSQYHKAKIDADFRRAFEGAQAYLDDVSRFANEAADQAPGLLPKTEGLGDAFRNIANTIPDARDARALAGPLFQGTLRDRIFTDAELRDPPLEVGKPLFAPLTDRQVTLYHQFRATVNHSLDTLAVSEMARLARTSGLAIPPREMGLDETVAFYRDQYEAPLEKVRADLAELEGTQADERNLLEQAADDEASSAEQRRRYAQLREDMGTRHAEERKGLQASLANLEMLEKGVVGRAELIGKLKRQGYAPLMRFGQYTVDVFLTDEEGKPVRDADGNDIRPFFGMFETEAEANKVARIMREEYPDFQVKQGVMSQAANELFKGVTPETVELFAKLQGDEQAEMFQAYLKLAVNNRSAMKRLIHRMGTAGFEQDPTRVLATFVTSNARAASGNYHFGEMLRATAEIPKDKGDVKDEAVKLLTYLQNPREEAAWMRSFLFAQFLGGSIASALVNMTQTFTTTYPYLHQFGPSVTGQIASAMKLAGKRLVSKGVAVGDAELAAALKQAEEEGIVSPHEIHMLQGESMRSGVLSGNRVTRSIMQVWGSFFSLAERYNRDVSFIAAYKVAQAKGMAGDAAYNFAREAVRETQFLYSKASKGNWGRNALGATLLTFRTFTVNYLEFLKRLPAKERALALAVLAVAAGLSGLPGADDLDDLIDTIAEGLGFAWNTKQERYAFLANTLGRNAADFATRGISAFMPLDVSARLGQQNLIPGSAVFKRSETDRLRDALEWLGPAGSQVMQLLRAYERIQSGGFTDPTKYADALLRDLGPKALTNAYQAYEMSQLGFYTDRLGRMVTQTTPVDAFVKGIGFQPTSVSEASEARQIVRQQIALMKAVKRGVAAQYAQGVFEKDPAMIERARQDLRDWNRKNPDARLYLDPASIRQRVGQLRLSANERLVMTAPRHMRAKLMEEMAGGE